MINGRVGIGTTNPTSLLFINGGDLVVDDFDTTFRHATRKSKAFRIGGLSENTRYKLIKIVQPTNRRMSDYRVTLTLTTPAIYSGRTAVISFTAGKPSG